MGFPAHVWFDRICSPEKQDTTLAHSTQRITSMVLLNSGPIHRPKTWKHSPFFICHSQPFQNRKESHSASGEQLPVFRAKNPQELHLFVRQADKQLLCFYCTSELMQPRFLKPKMGGVFLEGGSGFFRPVQGFRRRSSSFLLLYFTGMHLLKLSTALFPLHFQTPPPHPCSHLARRPRFLLPISGHRKKLFWPLETLHQKRHELLK